MKYLKKLTLVTAFILLLSFCLIACDKSESIYGRWTMIIPEGAVLSEQEEEILNKIDMIVSEKDNTINFEFPADIEFPEELEMLAKTMEAINIKIDELSEDKFTFNGSLSGVENSNSSGVIYYEIDGDRMTWKDEMGSSSEFIRK